MEMVFALGAVFLIVLVLVDAFESIVLPRRVTHRLRFARLFYRSSWMLWRSLARRMPAGKSRESLLSMFGPLSLLGLLTAWVIGLIVGFAILNWALAIPVQVANEQPTFAMYLYSSGV